MASLRSASAQLLLSRLISTCKATDGDASEAAAHFTSFYKRLFGPLVHTPFFGQSTISCQDVVDLMLLVAANCPALDGTAYALLRSAAFLLVCVNSLQGTRLMHTMEMNGFVHSDDYEAAAKSMHEAVRPPTVWDSLKNYIAQLCATLNWPSDRVVAGVYNSLVDRCKLPKQPVKKAVLKDVRKLVDFFYAQAKYRDRIKEYVAKNVSGTRQRDVKVNDDGDETVSILFTDVSDLSTRVPVFESSATCVNFALNCAEDLFLDESERRPVAWYQDQFLIVQTQVKKQAEQYTTGEEVTKKITKQGSGDNGSKRAERGPRGSPARRPKQDGESRASWGDAIEQSMITS
jgi:hypothetical protein